MFKIVALKAGGVSPFTAQVWLAETPISGKENFVISAKYRDYYEQDKAFNNWGY